jgi:hypothetical protein
VEARAVVGMIGGRYRLNGVLGEGGMARVFDAFDERLERPVAVKILRPQTEALPGMRVRFQQEARISARLVHPNIVAVLDYGEDGASSYLVMERLSGRTLRDEIAGGPVVPERLVPLLAETLGALAAAHRCGVLHRDIKPSNILLDDGHARITDFGIAKSFDVRAVTDPTVDLTMTGVVLGTPGYLAPERRAGDAATVQSDLYSVGAVMIEALSGRRPALGAEGDVHAPPELRPIATRALAPDPRQRYTSANAMLEALRQAGRRRSLPTTSLGATEPLADATAVLPRAAAATSVLRAPPAPPLRAVRRRWPRFLLPAFAVAIVGALLLLFLVEGGQPGRPHAPATSHTTVVRHHSTATSDPERTAITQLATSLAAGGLPGDGVLASALDATAAEAPGAGREASAEETLTLAGVLLAGGGISDGQFQDVANVLEATGATVPTTTVPTTTIPAPSGPKLHDHGPGGDKGPGGGN